MEHDIYEAQKNARKMLSNRKEVVKKHTIGKNMDRTLQEIV